MILDDLIRLLRSVPPEAYDALGRLFTSVASAPDPVEAARRAAEAIAAEEGADEILKKALGRSAP